MLKALAAALSLAALPALSDKQSALDVWDHEGTFVGHLLAQGQVVINVKGAPTAFEFDRTSIGDSLLKLYYTDANCSGTPYLDATLLPPGGARVDDDIWYPAGPYIQDLKPKSIFLWNTLPPGHCTAASAGTDIRDAVKAATAPAIKFEAPLCVSSHQVRCQ
jgi:hypothetical protein